MQKFYGFDSTIGVGRNFGFRVGEVKPPLDKPLILSIGEDIDMAGGVRLEFSQFGSFDSFSVYRSTAPMDIASLPTPIVTGLSKMYYVDPDAEQDMEHFYRVSVTRGDEVVISDEVSIIIESSTGPILTIPTDYLLRYDFNGDLFDRSGNLNHGAIINGTATYVAGRKPDTQAMKIYQGSPVIQSSIAVPFGTTAVTVSFWVYTDSANLRNGYLLSGKDDTGSHFAIAKGSWSSGWGAESRGVNSSGQNIFQASSDTSNDVWHHVIFEFDRTRNAINEIYIYIDNVKIAGTALGGYEHNIAFSPNKVMIGGYTGTVSTFRGLVQDIRIYDRVLTISEREALFNE